MVTPLGRRLNDSPQRLRIAAFLAVVTVLADLALVSYYGASEGSRAIALITLSAYLMLVKGDLASIGLTSSPVQGWRYWFFASLWIAGLVGAFILIGFAAWKMVGGDIPVYTTAPQAAGRVFLEACVFAPVNEEAIYRLVLCVPLAVLLGPWGAITISGLLFGLLHFAYGTPSPENLVAGFFLAWAYLKSGTILVPVLLHSIGNLLVLIFQIGSWFWITSAG